jgi:hypothetical protein
MLLVSLMVFVAFLGALALSEWAAVHWVRTRLQREAALNDVYLASDPFEQDEF